VVHGVPTHSHLGATNPDVGNHTQIARFKSHLVSLKLAGLKALNASSSPTGVNPSPLIATITVLETAVLNPAVHPNTRHRDQRYPPQASQRPSTLVL
jgi:hypothetical protein